MPSRVRSPRISGLSSNDSKCSNRFCSYAVMLRHRAQRAGGRHVDDQLEVVDRTTGKSAGLAPLRIRTEATRPPGPPRI
jgi:hypothetical protein